jgi:DNA-3-methyladenine glycosylase II
MKVGDRMDLWQEHILTHLSSKDETMAFLIKHLTLNPIEFSQERAFMALINTVIAQQLASSVASRLSAQFKEKFSPLKKDHLKGYDALAFKAIGLSKAKSETIVRILDSDIDFEALKDADNETIINTLTTIKGLGPWSAEMFILFVKQDENYFSFKDGGIRNALNTFYPEKNHKALVEKFSPYKSYACFILWQALAYKKHLLKLMEENND